LATCQNIIIMICYTGPSLTAAREPKRVWFVTRGPRSPQGGSVRAIGRVSDVGLKPPVATDRQTQPPDRRRRRHRPQLAVTAQSANVESGNLCEQPTGTGEPPRDNRRRAVALGKTSDSRVDARRPPNTPRPPRGSNRGSREEARNTHPGGNIRIHPHTPRGKEAHHPTHTGRTTLRRSPSRCRNGCTSGACRSSSCGTTLAAANSASSSHMRATACWPAACTRSCRRARAAAAPGASVAAGPPPLMPAAAAGAAGWKNSVSCRWPGTSAARRRAAACARSAARALVARRPPSIAAIAATQMTRQRPACRPAGGSISQTWLACRLGTTRHSFIHDLLHGALAHRSAGALGR
jgi:hypothetical protein